MNRKPLRVFLISGSNRRQYDCPGVDSKSRALMLRMAEQMPEEWEVDVEDLGNVFGRPRIQPCNGCVSTSMALCVWPCNCYAKNNGTEPDLMWNLDMYGRLDLADAWAIIGPVNWYGPTSTFKLMFDRLVCMNGGNPREDLIKHKDPELAMELEHKPIWKELSKNHLGGRTAGFFTYGDAGGDEIGEDGRPNILENKDYFNPAEEPHGRDAYKQIIWQCRYAGIEVPTALNEFVEFGIGGKYSDNQAEHMVMDKDVMAKFDAWCARFAHHVEKKGKVKPGKYRAHGYEAPGKFVSELKLYKRAIQMATGKSPVGSSPEIQDRLGLNKDRTLLPRQSTAVQLKKFLGNRKKIARDS